MVFKKIKKIAKKHILRSIGRFLYFIGLTYLIPFLPVLLASEVSLHEFFNKSVWISISLSGFGGLLIFFSSWSVRKTLRTLGFSTILPAILAFVFSLFGRQFILSILSISNISSELIVPWIDKYVPSVLAVAVTYLVIGVVLIAASFFFREF